MEISVQEIKPLLTSPVEDKVAKTLIDAALSYLGGRYSEAKLTKYRPFVVVVVAAMISRRGSGRDPFLASETAGPFRAHWFSGGATAGLFHADELWDLDRLLGGGARTVRTPAPDEQRFSNLYRPGEWEDELGEVELPAPGGWCA